jgi:3-isopropylmalate/(R)-2-methylmalate dehydratase large subunit
MTIVCGDSHTSTHGAFGAMAFGIGTSEVGHVLATSACCSASRRRWPSRSRASSARRVTAKDVILHVIGVIGVKGGTGYAIEYRGSAIRAMDMEGRMTLCNMSIEAGARCGMVAPDEVTFEYLRGKPRRPRARMRRRCEVGSSLKSDPDAVFDRVVRIDAADIRPTR